MKRFFILTLVLLLICTVGLAEITPSYATDEVTREYKYEDDELILQEEDLAADNLCTTIREIVKEDIGEKESIEEISLDSESVLHIILNWEPNAIPQYFENYDIARDRFSRITDSLLSYEELDVYWNEILFKYPNGEALFTKDMIVDSEYGRYFDCVDELIQ